MKRAILGLAGLFPRATLLLALPLAALALTPSLPAGDAKLTLHCPVVGPGNDVQKDGCSGYCGRKVSPKLTLNYRGSMILFCCDRCKQAFQKAPGQFAASANLQLVASAQAVQQKCPLCGGQAESQFTQKIAGVAVQFCTAACRDKVARASAAEQFQLIFGNTGFDKGFVVTAKTSAQSRTATNTTGGQQDTPSCCCECQNSATVLVPPGQVRKAE